MRSAWCRACSTADDLKGYHGVNERLSIDNLRLGTQIVFDIAARIVAP